MFVIFKKHVKTILIAFFVFTLTISLSVTSTVKEREIVGREMVKTKMTTLEEIYSVPQLHPK